MITYCVKTCVNVVSLFLKESSCTVATLLVIQHQYDEMK
jgi:hypothetical protein